MNSTPLSVLAAALLLSSVAAGCLSSTPVVQSAPSAVPTLSTEPPDPSQDRPGGGALEGLTLTPEQTAKIRQIRRESRAQIQSLLTPEQQEQFAGGRKQGSLSPGQEATERKGLRDLNLSPEQRAQIRQIQRSSREQIQALLTPEQQQQYQQSRQNRQGAEPEL